MTHLRSINHYSVCQLFLLPAFLPTAEVAEAAEAAEVVEVFLNNAFRDGLGCWKREENLLWFKQKSTFQSVLAWEKFMYDSEVLVVRLSPSLQASKG